MIHLIAVLIAKSGHRECLLSALRSELVRLRSDPGCPEYQPVVDLPDSPVKFGIDTLVMIEKCEDGVALNAHNQGEAFQRFTKKMEPHLKQVDVYLMQDARLK